MDKIEIFGFLLINILMWAIAYVDPRGIQHFAPALIIGASGLIVISLLAKYLKAREK